MIHLLFIVPYPEIREKVEYVLKNHREKDRLAADILLRSANETSDIDISAYDAVIARGYSASALKASHPNIPLITLPISGYDIIRAVVQCRETFHPKKIAICGFYDELYEAKEICRLFGCETEVYSAADDTQLEQVMKDAVSKGCDALIGGYSAKMYAARHGMNFCLIRTGEEAVRQAIDEAVRTADRIHQERLNAETYKTIIYASRDGTLFADPDGIIQVRNHAVRSMCGGSSLLGRSLETSFPFLWDTFQEVLKSAQEISGKIYTLPGGKLTVSASFTPVIVNRVVSGIVITLTDITQIQKLESQIRRSLSEKGLRSRYHFEDILHESSVIDRTIETARRYAGSEANIIIVGETGTGKELFAQSIHNASPRKNGPFVAINCAALPENLLESELFGYVEGAFTGTVKGGKIGLFEQAHGGTLFLDEIGEISMSTQAKLLRVLQEREVRRIGDNKVISVNVRVISATNKNLTRMADEGLFRRDLPYRLDVLRLFLPPLRQRGGDAKLLFLHYLKQQSQENERAMPDIDLDALSVLNDYEFKGNIRELRNIVERVGVLCDRNIHKEDILAALYPQSLEDSPQGPASPIPDAEDEKHTLEWALNQCGGNHSKAAKLLGIDRSTLYRKLKKYGIRP